MIQQLEKTSSLETEYIKQFDASALIKNNEAKVKLSDYFGFVEQGIWTKRVSLD